MKGNFIIFLKYIFNFRGFIEGFFLEMKKMLEPKRLAVILFFIAVYCFIRYPAPRNKILFSIFIILALVSQLRNSYLGGDHIRWNRERKGIKSKKEIKELKKEEKWKKN